MTMTIRVERTHPVGRECGRDVAALVEAPGRWLRILRQRLTCLLVGHAKWEVPCGDWVCMNCALLRQTSAPILSDDDGKNRRQLDAVRGSFEVQ